MRRSERRRRQRTTAEHRERRQPTARGRRAHERGDENEPARHIILCSEIARDAIFSRKPVSFTVARLPHRRRRVQCNPAFVGLTPLDRHFTHAMSVSHDQTDVCLTRCRSNGTRPTSASRRRRCQCFFRHRVSQMSVRTAQTDVLMSRCRSRYNGPTFCQQTSVCVPRTAFT